MGGGLFVSVVLSATGASGLKLASTAWTGLSVAKDQAALFSEHFAVKLTEQGFSIITAKDLEQMLGLERQKQLLGCATESSSCTAELAGALGVDALVTGQVSKVGSSLQVIVKILASDGHTLFSYSSEPFAQEDRLLVELTQVSERAATQLRQHFGGAAPPQTATERPIIALVPAAVGAIALAIGAGFWIDAGQRHARLTQAVALDLSPAEARSLKDTGERNQLIGIALTAVGAVAAIAGVTWYVVGGKKSVSVAMAPGYVGLAVA
jgi:hypothetical protein